MSRLIDADELIKYIKIWEIGTSISSDQKEFIDCINKQLTEANDLTCIKKAKRRNRTRPVSEILLMMFRSANRDYRKAVKQLEEMKKND